MTTDQKQLSIEDTWARLRPIVIDRRALSSRDEALDAARAYGLAVLEALSRYVVDDYAPTVDDVRAQIEALT